MNTFILITALMLTATATAYANLNIDPKAYHAQRMEEKKLRQQHRAETTPLVQPQTLNVIPENKSVEKKFKEAPKAVIAEEKNETATVVETNNEMPLEKKD